MINRNLQYSYKYDEEKKNAEANLKMAIFRCLDVGITSKQIALIVVKILKGKQP